MKKTLTPAFRKLKLKRVDNYINSKKIKALNQIVGRVKYMLKEFLGILFGIAIIYYIAIALEGTYDD